jgi:hypothetical protein
MDANGTGNKHRGGDFPDPVKEQDKCREFLSNFTVNESRKYIDQLVKQYENNARF